MEMSFRSVWGSVRLFRAQKPHTSPTTPAPTLKKYTRGELNTSMVFGALRRKSINVSVGGLMKQNMASRRERRREKVRAGPGLGECEAGYATNNCGELRVR